MMIHDIIEPFILRHPVSFPGYLPITARSQVQGPALIPQLHQPMLPQQWPCSILNTDREDSPIKNMNQNETSDQFRIASPFKHHGAALPVAASNPFARHPIVVAVEPAGLIVTRQACGGLQSKHPPEQKGQSEILQNGKSHMFIHINIRTVKYTNRYYRLPAGSFPWPARPFKHTESNSFEHTVATFRYNTNWYFILPPGPRGLARTPHIYMSVTIYIFRMFSERSRVAASCAFCCSTCCAASWLKGIPMRDESTLRGSAEADQSSKVQG